MFRTTHLSLYEFVWHMIELRQKSYFHKFPSKFFFLNLNPGQPRTLLELKLVWNNTDYFVYNLIYYLNN
jgi:hypothetical protein